MQEDAAESLRSIGVVISRHTNLYQGLLPMATDVITRDDMHLHMRHLLDLADEGSPAPLVEYIEQQASITWEDGDLDEVIPSRYPDATAHIATHASLDFLKNYALAFPQDRGDMAEAIVESGDMDRMVFFATKVLSAPLSDAEPHILASKNADLMVSYAQHALHAPWEAAEACILETATKNAAPAIRYACEVKHDRWPELESILLENAQEYRCHAAMIEYFKLIKRSVEDGCKAFDNGRWHAAEAALLAGYNASRDPKSLDLVAIGMYSTGLPERWIAGEKAVASDYQTALEYVALTQDRLPELERRIMTREPSSAMRLFEGYKDALSDGKAGKFLPSFETLRHEYLQAAQTEKAVERSLAIDAAIDSYAKIDRVSASKAALEEHGAADIDFGPRDDEFSGSRSFGGFSV